MTSQEIRRQFIDFFVQKHGHTFVPSSPVVPHDDPTLLFANAGMNQFKPIFLGTEKRPYTRVANTQKCIRAGGKHNDLDDVGRSRRHHTFFEMLGNWSFGDYFKKEAIAWSWELLTQVWKLDPTRIHVTVHAGDEAIGVPRDDEAAQIWRDVAGVPVERIHYGNTRDNFWEMGETGPCGPCTEIFVDRTPDKTGGPSVLSGEDPRVMEIWNNVFIQYNRNADKSLTPLPAKHVDTGMGFERICQVIQGKDDNYGIDLFDPFFDAITKLTGIKYTGQYPKTNAADPVAESANPQLRHDIAFRVITDHLRCLTFALTDGAMPSNEGRGYVLRRILRRAVRFGRQQLELREPFLHQLVPVVVDSMGEAFPELKKNPNRVVELVRDEEVSFGKTLDRGIEHFEEAFADVVGSLYAELHGLEFSGAGWQEKPNRGAGNVNEQYGMMLNFRENARQSRMEAFDVPLRQALESLHNRGIALRPLPAQAAFKLHDTYGFPIDLTQIMAGERGMTVDISGYERLMEEAREKARAGGKGGDSALFELPPNALAELSKSGIKSTDDSAKFKFEPIQARVAAIWNGSNLDPSAETSSDQEVAVILDRTSFYAEMGGQVGDSGVVTSATTQFDIETTRAFGGYVLHIGRVRSGSLRVGDQVTATVSASRKPTMQNHTATHLANWALREVLGEEVQQKGSLVDPEKLRFDFSHGKSMNDDELAAVEKHVNALIARKLPVHAREAAQQDALKINGLRAVFGEKYPPMVRVISIGAAVVDLLMDPGNQKWRQYSIEFCGGTHLDNSSEIENFVVTLEESVSKGIRRIVALTGVAASAAISKSKELDATLTRAESLPEAQIPQVLAELQKQLGAEGLPLRAKRRGQAVVSELQQKFKTWEKSQKSSSSSIDAGQVASDLLAKGPIVVAAIDGASDDQLRAVMDSIKKRSPSFAALLGATDGTNVSFVAAVSDDYIAKGLKAGDWIRETAKVAGGGGGGRPHMAQAGGKDPAKLNEALDVARQFAAKCTGA